MATEKRNVPHISFSPNLLLWFSWQTYVPSSIFQLIYIHLCYISQGWYQWLEVSIWRETKVAEEIILDPLSPVLVMQLILVDSSSKHLKLLPGFRLPPHLPWTPAWFPGLPVPVSYSLLWPTLKNPNLGPVGVAPLVECLPDKHKAPASHKPGMMMHSCNSSTQEAKAGTEVRTLHGMHNQLKTILGLFGTVPNEKKIWFL